MNVFNNKKVLFISSGFYQYDDLITNELRTIIFVQRLPQIIH